MAEKYYGLSPYNYVAGNPVIATDPDGREISTIVKDLGNGKYEVDGGDPNDENNGVYL